MASEKLIIQNVTFHYPSVFTPKAFSEGEEAKYQVTLLIDKDDADTLDAIEDAIEEEAKNAGLKGKYATPLQDGDEIYPDDENYADKMFLRCKSKDKPGVVGPDLEPIMDKSEFYAGCKGHASVVMFAYTKTGKGVTCLLKNVMKTEDGEQLTDGAGNSKPEDDFAEFKQDKPSRSSRRDRGRDSEDEGPQEKRGFGRRRR